MKYGFSTLVCPGWQWDEIVTAASDLGFDGVELRGVGREIDLTKSRLFTGAGAVQVKDNLKRLGLQIPCLSAGLCLSDGAVQEEALREASGYIALAAELGVKFVRVLADLHSAPSADGVVDEAVLRSSLAQLLEQAQGKGVTLLIETNGVFADSARLRTLCEVLAHPNLGVLWDVHHPYRFFGERPEDTYSNLKSFISHVHVKDSVMADGKVRYRMLGEGDLPLKDVMRVLKHGGYDGFVILEWVKRWNMDLEEPGIVLPHFINAVKAL